MPVSISSCKPNFHQEWQAERKRLSEEKMSKCKRTGFDLEKMEDLEEEKRLKKKKGREMEEGPGRPQQILLGLPGSVQEASQLSGCFRSR